MELIGTMEITAYKGNRPVVCGLREELDAWTGTGLPVGTEYISADDGKRFLFDGTAWHEAGGMEI